MVPLELFQILADSTPQVKKLVDLVKKFSEKNNLIIVSGVKIDGLYTSSLSSPNREANLSVNTSHFANVQEMVYVCISSLRV